MKAKQVSLVLIFVGIFLVFFVYPSVWNKGAGFLNSRVKLEKIGFKLPNFLKVPDFRLGLDLLGGSHLIYQADLSSIGDRSSADAMAGVRDVIERRVNMFGVTEPIVRVEGDDRLVVELAGVSDISKAIEMIGQTPFLEFREQAENQEASGSEEELNFVSTGLTGRHLKRARLIFDPNTSQPQVDLELTDEGSELFAKITEKNLGKIVAIFIDGSPISIPVVQDVISTGKAVISGRFSLEEAKTLANRLNAGALPVPISLISQQTIGASLGRSSLEKSLEAGIFGLIAVAVFMVAFYRLPGLVSVLALLFYVVVVLTVYKILPVTLTLPGIAGFILSLGIAVDANVLIFARLREELKSGKSLTQSMDEGFHRAWFAIRDGHVTTILGAAVLYIFSTSMVKGFALTLGIGVLTSLLTATVVTRCFLASLIGPKLEKRKWLF